MDEPDARFTFAGFVERAGAPAFLAELAGLVVLVLAIRAARRRAPRSHALALFAAAWLPLLPLLAGPSFGTLGLFLRSTLRWSDPGAPGVAAILEIPARGDATRPTMVLSGVAVGLLFGLSGSVAALARSRPSSVRERAP